MLLEEYIKNNNIVRSSLTGRNSIQNVISHVASMSSNLSYDNKDLIALSVSIAETFCIRKDVSRRLFLDVSTIIQRDHLSGIQRVVRAISKELVTNPQKLVLSWFIQNQMILSFTEQIH